MQEGSRAGGQAWPHRLRDLNVESPGHGTIRRCDLVRGSTSLWVGFEVSDARVRPSGSLFLLCMDPVLELSVALQHHICLHATLLPTMIMG